MPASPIESNFSLALQNLALENLHQQDIVVDGNDLVHDRAIFPMYFIHHTLKLAKL